MIKKFVLWFVLKIHYGQFKHNGKVVRAFSEEWYNKYIKGINIVKTKQALEKQIPKKPEKLGKEKSIENSYWIKCECGAVSLVDIKSHNQMYCSECGQLMSLDLDWSEEDEV